jgi:hypothetical protein
MRLESKYGNNFLANLEQIITKYQPTYTQIDTADGCVLTLDSSTASHTTFDVPTDTKKKVYSPFYSNSNLTMYDIYYNTNSYFNESIFGKFFLTNPDYFNAYYDFLQLDETSDVDSNARHYLTTQPFRLIRGVLNQHVVDILQSTKFENTKLTKMLFLNTKFSQSGEMLKDKELMPETL